MSDTAQNIGSSVDKIDELDENEQSKPKKKKKKAAPPPPPPAEKTGVGEDNSAENIRILGATLREKIAAAEKSGNTSLAERLKANLAALEASAQ